MQSMSNEFDNFIAKNILHFFQTRADEMQPGERYCLKLDTQEMVAGVDDELRKKLKLGIAEEHEYEKEGRSLTKLQNHIKGRY